MPLSRILEGTAENLAAALEGDEHDLTLDREDVQDHVAFQRDAAKDAAVLEARPVMPAADASLDAAPIEQRMAVAGSKLHSLFLLGHDGGDAQGLLLAEAHVVPTSGATFGAGLLSDCARLLVEGHAQIVVARQQVREQGNELLACKAAAEHGLGAVDSEGTPSFTVSLLATEHRNLQARLAERDRVICDGLASALERAADPHAVAKLETALALEREANRQMDADCAALRAAFEEAHPGESPTVKAIVAAILETTR